jgi:UDP-N-acetylmuramoyl-tripeptide--D-alanyl-D-alanine ligase
VTIINDAYNANPPSVEMAVRSLSHLKGKGRPFVVLGDMLELGVLSPMAHRRVGRLIATLKLAGVFLLGDQAAHVAEGAVEEGMDPQRIWTGKNHHEIADLLKDQTRPGDWILVKGSRRMRMETVIEIFKEEG